MHTTRVRYPYKLMQKYPGLRPNDEILWDEFIKNNPVTFDWVYYDVPVGDPTASDERKQSMQRNGAFEVSQWRIDVVGFSKGEPVIIEVKPNAAAGAIGQVLSYKALLVAEGSIDQNTPCMILTDEISPITEHACKLLDIMIHVP